MMQKVTDKQLQIKCRFDILSIHKCSIHAQYGNHTRAEATVVVEGEKARAVVPDIADEGIKIICADKDSAIEQVLFCGVIDMVELTGEGNYAVLNLSAVSHTWKMDIQKRSRSFQNLSMTYQDTVQIITREYGVSLVWNVPDKRLESPLIQYKETDYRFLARILSHLHEGITAGDFSAGICICAGVREGDSRGSITLDQYSYSAEPFCEKKAGNIQRTKYMGYRIDGLDFVRVGDRMQIHGMVFYVMETHTAFTGGCLRCSCLVFPKQCFRVPRTAAKTLEGAVLTGRILETRQESVRMHLGIDRVQNPSEAYEFPWRPITGNMLYCMPERGTRAALYFGGADESTGEVICNIRENGLLCGELADSDNRYFTTSNQKRIYMEPSEMGLASMAGRNAEIAIRDSAVLGIKTSNKMSLLAEGQVELKGKNVIIMTPKEATLVRKDILSPTVVNLCNAFDSIGQVGSFASNAEQVGQKKRKKTPDSQAVEKYEVADITRNILANIPAGDMGSPAMEAVAAGMPIFSRSGSAGMRKGDI